GLQLQRVKSMRQQADHGCPAEAAKLDGRHAPAAILETVAVRDGQNKAPAGPENAVDFFDRSFRALQILQSLQRDHEIEAPGGKGQPVEVGTKIFSRMVARGASQGTRGKIAADVMVAPREMPPEHAIATPGIEN